MCSKLYRDFKNIFLLFNGINEKFNFKPPKKLKNENKENFCLGLGVRYRTMV